MRWLTMLRQWFAEWFGTVKQPAPVKSCDLTRGNCCPHAEYEKCEQDTCPMKGGVSKLKYDFMRRRLQEAAPELLTEHDAGRMTIQQAWQEYRNRVSIVGVDRKLVGEFAKWHKTDPDLVAAVADGAISLTQARAVYLGRQGQRRERDRVKEAERYDESAPPDVPFPTVAEVLAVDDGRRLFDPHEPEPQTPAEPEPDSPPVVQHYPLERWDDPLPAEPLRYEVPEAPAPHVPAPSPPTPPTYDSGPSSGSYDSGSSGGSVE